MAKFLGIISNNYKHPSQDVVYEFTDLEVIADQLLRETQSLFCDFQRKAQCIVEQEMNLTSNLDNLTELDTYSNALCSRTLEMEQDLDTIGQCMCYLEKVVDCLETIPAKLYACKCMANPQRSLILEELVKMSQDYLVIENQMEQLSKEELFVAVQCPCDWTKFLFSFLEFHTQILENISRKIDQITDQVKHIDGLFINAKKKLSGSGYHKTRHEINQSFC